MIQKFIFLILVTGLLCQLKINAEEVRQGDVVLTRNKGDETINSSPGYYNHVAIVVEDNWVIEAQQSPDSVIAVPIWLFFDRYPEVLVLRNKDPIVANLTAGVAPKFVGRRYAKYMSVRPLYLWKNADNCVSLIKRIYNQVGGLEPKWLIPDHILADPRFRPVAHKKDYENYVPPASMYEGAITIWPPRK
jgi:hypothetical protein